MDYMIVFSRFARRAVLFNSIKDVWAGFYVIRSFLTHEITYRPFAITRPNCKPARTLKIFNIYFQRNDKDVWAGFYVIRSFLTHEITYRPFAIIRPNCKPARTLKIFNIYFQRNDRKAWLHKQGIFLNSIPAQLFSLI